MTRHDRLSRHGICAAATLALTLLAACSQDELTTDGDTPSGDDGTPSGGGTSGGDTSGDDDESMG